MNEELESTSLTDHEFRIFSQSGEDGIIQYLIRSIPVANQTFIEFGVEDFQESNCRFLLAKDNWRGFVIDGSAPNIERLQGSELPWRYQLDSVSAFVTRENINDVLAMSGFAEDLGILSIDIDGNDYYIWEAITGFRPRILIIEYNSIFGPDRKVTIPYRADFDRKLAHSSHQYYGASLAAINDLAERKGYALVGVNSTGVNAFFIREDLLNSKVKRVSVTQAFRSNTFGELRKVSEGSKHDSSAERIRILAGMKVLNVVTNELEEAFLGPVQA